MKKNSQVIIRKMILILFLVIALILSHVNCLALMMSDSDWISFSFMRSFDRNHMLFSGEIRAYQESEVSMNMTGQMHSDFIVVSFAQAYLELLKITVDKDLNTVQLDTILGDMEPMSFDQLEMVQDALKMLSENGIDAECVEKHKIYNDIVTDVYMVENQLYLAIDYTGQIQKAWGNIGTLYTFEISFTYD